MRARTSVYIATSLDGYIARPDGGLDWLDSGAPPGGEDYGYQAFIDTVDTLVMGRHTFETALGFEAWPYAGKRVVVLTSGGVNIPPALAAEVTSTAGAPLEIVERLSAAGAQHLYIDGGVTIQRFLAAGLIDEMTITRIPVLLGKGLPLFGPLATDLRLAHVATRAFDNGFVQSRYRHARPR